MLEFVGVNYGSNYNYTIGGGVKSLLVSGTSL